MFFLLSWVRPVLTWGGSHLPAFSAWLSLNQSAERSLDGSMHPPSQITSISLKNKDMVFITWLLDQICNKKLLVNSTYLSSPSTRRDSPCKCTTSLLLCLEASPTTGACIIAHRGDMERGNVCETLSQRFGEGSARYSRVWKEWMKICSGLQLSGRITPKGGLPGPSQSPQWDWAPEACSGALLFNTWLPSFFNACLTSLLPHLCFLKPPFK